MAFLLLGRKLAETGQPKAEASTLPDELKAAGLACDHLRADKGLERAADGRSECVRIDMDLRNHEGLADVRAALLINDLDQFSLETSARCWISKLEDALHPIIEAFGRAIEQHQSGVTGNKLKICRVDPATGELSGTPAKGDVGKCTAAIVVTDGMNTTNGEIKLTVK